MIKEWKSRDEAFMKFLEKQCVKLSTRVTYDGNDNAVCSACSGLPLSMSSGESVNPSQGTVVLTTPLREEIQRAESNILHGKRISHENYDYCDFIGFMLDSYSIH